MIMNEGLKITLSIDDEDAIYESWKQAVQRIVNLDMQFKALPPHVKKDSPSRTERDYLTEYLQQQRMQMYKEDISKGLIKEVW